MTAVPREDAVRVLIVEDHVLIAQSLKTALGAEGFCVALGDLDGRLRLLRNVEEFGPDLVVLDLDLGASLGSGETLVPELSRSGARVLVLTGSGDRVRFGTALEAGAVDVISKSEPFDRLLGAVIAAARGDSTMAETEKHRLLGEMKLARQQRRALRQTFEQLTNRERQVLLALADGSCVSQIAEAWVVSEATVRSQVRGVLTKLGVSSQLEAVALAHRSGWTRPEQR